MMTSFWRICARRYSRLLTRDSTGELVVKSAEEEEEEEEEEEDAIETPQPVCQDEEKIVGHHPPPRYLSMMRPTAIHRCGFKNIDAGMVKYSLGGIARLASLHNTLLASCLAASARVFALGKVAFHLHDATGPKPGKLDRCNDV